MKYIPYFILFILTCTPISDDLFAQSNAEPIKVENRLMGPVFLQNDQNLTPNQLADITKGNPEAYATMKKARTNYVLATIFGVLGGGFIGYPIGTAIGGGDPVWELAGIGAGLVAISIPFTLNYNKNAKEAVRIYNESLNESAHRSLGISLGFSPGGLGIKLKF